MTTEEYIQGRREIAAAREELHRKELALREEFVKSLTDEGMIGSKVRCYREDEYLGDAFLSGVDYSGRFDLKKVKKDGTMSYVSAGYWSVDRIERA